MASPFSKEEKQMLLEAKDLEIRKKKLEQIIKLYNLQITLAIKHYNN